jgi:hypothetical protein
MSRAPTNAGAIAFFRIGDPNLCELTEDVVISRYDAPLRLNTAAALAHPDGR